MNGTMKERQSMGSRVGSVEPSGRTNTMSFSKESFEITNSDSESIIEVKVMFLSENGRITLWIKERNTKQMEQSSDACISN